MALEAPHIKIKTRIKVTPALAVPNTSTRKRTESRLLTSLLTSRHPRTKTSLQASIPHPKTVPARLTKAHLIKAHIKILTKTKAKTKREVATKTKAIVVVAVVTRNPNTNPNTNLIPRTSTRTNTAIKMESTAPAQVLNTVRLINTSHRLAPAPIRRRRRKKGT